MSFVKTLITGGPDPTKAVTDNAFDQNSASALGGDVTSGVNNQQAFVNATQAQNGLGNQSQVFGQQQALANQLQQQANGQGPNVALDQLNQTTGQNVANQAALMAGQRGSGANAGLLARQAAMQGANTQQQAVGQGATLEAQQQIAAQQALGQQQSNMANLATSQVGQQANALNNYNSAAQGAAGQVNAQNSGTINATNGFNTAQQAQTSSQLGLVGALAGAGSSAIVGKARGGMINEPKSHAGRHVMGFSNYAAGGAIPGQPTVPGKDSYKNDKVPIVASPGEIVIPLHITSAKDAPKMAAEFVRQVLAKKKGMIK